MADLAAYALLSVGVVAGFFVGAIWDEKHAGRRDSLIRVLLFVVSIVLGTYAFRMTDPDISFWLWSVLTGMLPIILGIWVGPPLVTWAERTWAGRERHQTEG